MCPTVNTGPLFLVNHLEMFMHILQIALCDLSQAIILCSKQLLTLVQHHCIQVK